MTDLSGRAATAFLLMSMAPVNAAIAAPAAPPTAVQPAAGSGECTFRAWTSFHVDAAIAVRSAPSATAKVLGHLPVPTASDDDAGSVEFDVVQARTGWLKIDHASDPAGLDENGRPAQRPPVYQGAGWISADAAQIGIQSALGYARPDADSPVILDLGSDWLTEMGQIGVIRDCSSPWLLLDYEIRHERGPTDALLEVPVGKRKRGTAWFRGICENQFTTCDMRSVDQRK